MGEEDNRYPWPQNKLDLFDVKGHDKLPTKNDSLYGLVRFAGNLFSSIKMCEVM